LPDQHYILCTTGLPKALTDVETATRNQAGRLDWSIAFVFMTYGKLAIIGGKKGCDAFQSVLSLHGHIRFNSSARQSASRSQPARLWSADQDGKLPVDDPAGKTLSVFLKTLGIGQ